jgi:PAS domain S-box-containing protein
MVNDSFLDFLKLSREELIGQAIQDTILKIFKDHTEIIIGIQEALEGKKSIQEINFQMNKKSYFLKISIVPTTFEDGKHGATIIIKNNTHKKLTENALRETEENFKNLINKINNK